LGPQLHTSLHQYCHTTYHKVHNISKTPKAAIYAEQKEFSTPKTEKKNWCKNVPYKKHVVQRHKALKNAKFMT
jgi:hypothetical protein